MPTYYARKSGNINATDVWATTPSGTAAAVTFASGDVLVANSFTVTVNVNTDLGSTGEVRNDTTGGATAGGTFTLQGVTLTANVFAGGSGNTNCVTASSASAMTIVGKVTGGSANNAYGVNYSGLGSLSITGSIAGGTSTAPGVLAAGGTLTVTGNVTGGSGVSFGYGLRMNLGTVSITGTVTGGTGSAGVMTQSSGTLTITGSVNGATAVGVDCQTSNGTITVIGTATGGAAAGVLVTGNNAVTVNVTRAKGGPNATSAAGVTGGAFAVVNIEEIEFGDLGAPPLTSSVPYRLSDKTSNVCIFYRFGTTKKTLVDTASTSLLPAASDVRFGVSYNSGVTTGTCRVPTAANVLQGVLVDNTTGTAIMTPAGFWDYLTSNANTSGSMGERLKNCATVTSTGQQIADAVGA